MAAKKRGPIQQFILDTLDDASVSRYQMAQAIGLREPAIYGRLDRRTSSDSIELMLAFIGATIRCKGRALKFELENGKVRTKRT